MQPDLRGACHALYAFDIGFHVNVDRARSLLQDSSALRLDRTRRPAPSWFDYEPAPVRLLLDAPAITVGRSTTEPTAELLIYDFGAAVVTFRLPFASLDEMRDLSILLHANAAMESAARAIVERTCSSLADTIERPRLRDVHEDYAIFAITSWSDGDARAPADIVESCSAALAQVVESDRATLSEAQVERTLAGRMGYTPDDLAIIDWNSAVLFDRDPADVIALLQHANVELLELRVLDQELDEILDHADDALASIARQRLWPSILRGRSLARFASVQTDAAVMFEGVNNAIKLLGNQYLARLYRLASERLDLPAWQASVQRKLAAADGIYDKLSDAAGTRRMETLEVIIIILIAVSTLVSFWPGH